MWSFGYEDDNGGEFCFFESFHGGRKLRPLVPRPSSSSLRVNGAHISSQNCNIANIWNDRSKKELWKYNTDDDNNNSSSLISAPLIVSSSRWNPTAEQVGILEELYRRGTRTPTADQIHHIAAQLRRFGRIEGKNVFYWFQNHKARERQKRRRQTALQQTKYSDFVNTEAEKTKCSSAPSKICGATISQQCTKTQRTPTVVELEKGERRDETWNNNPVNGQLMNPTNGVVEPRDGDGQHRVFNYNDNDNDNENEESETTTLQLFPLRSTKHFKYDHEREGRDNVSNSDMIESTIFSPSYYQFFEFLPLKT